MLGPFQITLFRLADPAHMDLLAAQRSRQPFPVTFETVLAELESWPRMFIEPDGSFVWVGEERNFAGVIQKWQLDGHLYDRDDRLLFVELQGNCPRGSLEKIVETLGISLDELWIEQRREGTSLAGRDFLA